MSVRLSVPADGFAAYYVAYSRTGYASHLTDSPDGPDALCGVVLEPPFAQLGVDAARERSGVIVEDRHGKPVPAYFTCVRCKRRLEKREEVKK